MNASTNKSVKHTPGPWFVDKRHGSFSVRNADRYVADSFTLGHSAAEAEANAALIAASPEMAELLRRWSLQGVLPELAQETRDLLRKAGVRP